MCAFKNPVLERVAKYVTLVLTMTFQARGAFNLQNTVWPVVIFLCLPVGVCAYRVQLPNVCPLSMAKAAGCMGVGLIFFYLGLNENEDPARILHSLWHLFCGAGSYYMWSSLRHEGVTTAEWKWRS
uniref:Transmembrane protein n=1 Tax=Trypanosoma vivax (strain Y486) TaxID=1055687 RepID=G0TZ86_TRYVY|nr:conserved hypothetical protein [Trypanosoma vivax Y486]